MDDLVKVNFYTCDIVASLLLQTRLWGRVRVVVSSQLSPSQIRVSVLPTNAVLVPDCFTGHSQGWAVSVARDRSKAVKARAKARACVKFTAVRVAVHLLQCHSSFLMTGPPKYLTLFTISSIIEHLLCHTEWGKAIVSRCNSYSICLLLARHLVTLRDKLHKNKFFYIIKMWFPISGCVLWVISLLILINRLQPNRFMKGLHIT